MVLGRTNLCTQNFESEHHLCAKNKKFARSVSWVPVKNGSALWFTRVKNFLRNNAAAVITFDLLVVNT